MHQPAGGFAKTVAIPTHLEGSDQCCAICNCRLPGGGPYRDTGTVVGPRSVEEFGFGSMDWGWELTIVFHSESVADLQVTQFELGAQDPAPAGYRFTALSARHISPGLLPTLGYMLQVQLLGSVPFPLRFTSEEMVVEPGIRVGEALCLAIENQARRTIFNTTPIAHIVEYWCKRHR